MDKLVLSMVEEKESKRPKSAEDVKQELVKIVKQSEELTRRSEQVGSYVLPPTTPTAQQQPIKLPGDAAANSASTFSINKQPDDTEPWPDWIIDLGKSYKGFVAWWSLTLFPLILTLFGRL